MSRQVIRLPVFSRLGCMAAQGDICPFKVAKRHKFRGVWAHGKGEPSDVPEGIALLFGTVPVLARYTRWGQSRYFYLAPLDAWPLRDEMKDVIPAKAVNKQNYLYVIPGRVRLRLTCPG